MEKKKEKSKNESSNIKEAIQNSVPSSQGSVQKFRDNPWIVSTIVLGLVVVLLVGFVGFGNSAGVVSEKMAADNLVSFIKNQQNNKDLALIVSSVQQEGQLYKVTLDYEGQEVPVYVSLDGKYLFSDVIPLDNTAGLSPGTGNIKVEAGDSPVKGKADAPVTLIEFSDFQCPFCQRFYQQTLSQIDDAYIKTGKVKLVYKDFPLSSIHPEAEKAAEAARCVREQKGDEGFYKMHNKLLENQQSFSVENYKKWARTLGVVGSKFDECLDEGNYAESIQEDLAYGESLGVSGTPAFFIEGKMISGAQSFEVFKQAIDAALEAK